MKDKNINWDRFREYKITLQIVYSISLEEKKIICNKLIALEIRSKTIYN